MPPKAKKLENIIPSINNDAPISPMARKRKLPGSVSDIAILPSLKRRGTRKANEKYIGAHNTEAFSTSTASYGPELVHAGGPKYIGAHVSAAGIFVCTCWFLYLQFIYRLLQHPYVSATVGSAFGNAVAIKAKAMALFIRPRLQWSCAPLKDCDADAFCALNEYCPT